MEIGDKVRVISRNSKYYGYQGVVINHNPVTGKYKVKFTNAEFGTKRIWYSYRSLIRIEEEIVDSTSDNQFIRRMGVRL